MSGCLLSETLITNFTPRTTGKFCDLMLGEWRENNSNTSHDCEDCIIGPMKIQVESGISYDKEVEEDFKLLTSSCKATGYDYTIPASYASRDTAPTTTTPSATQSWPCPTSYTVMQGDTCDSISQAQNASTFGLINTNNLNIFCDLPPVGKNICLPLACKLAFLQKGETCYTLQEAHGVTRAQLVAWNPNFDYQCINIKRWEHTYVCVGCVVLTSAKLIFLNADFLQSSRRWQCANYDNRPNRRPCADERGAALEYAMRVLACGRKIEI